MTATKNEINFDTLEELRDQAIKDRACEEGLKWLDKQKSLKEVFKNISLDNRIWCIGNGYIQFLDRCDFNKLNGLNWSRLLGEYPQFADKCNWKKLNGHEWCYLLTHQPQFADKCDWENFSNDDWSCLLREQPQLEKYKLDN